MIESLTHTPEISHRREQAPFPVLSELPTWANQTAFQWPLANLGVMTKSMSSSPGPRR